MGSIITTAIPTSSFELIRDRIGLILSEELTNQATLQSDPNLNAQVYIERFHPVNNTECPLVNVFLSDGGYDDQTRLSQDGTYTFFIDVYDKSKAVGSEDGGVLANFKLQKLANNCRAILSNPQYNTLAFAPPFIENTSITKIEVADPNKFKESENVVLARLTFVVRVPENSAAKTPNNIAGYVTQAVLGLTDKGFMYGDYTDVPPVEPICEPVDIYINTNFFVEATSGGLLDIDVVDKADGVTPVGEIIDGKVQVQITPDVYFDRPYFAQSVSYYADDEGYQFINETDTYYWAIPDNARLQKLDPANNEFIYYDDSAVTGISEHKRRFVGSNGGYYDYDSAIYYDVDGNVSTGAAEFFTPLGFYYTIDRLTGLGIYSKSVEGSTSWTSKLDTISALTTGFSDWLMLTWYQNVALFDTLVINPFYSSGGRGVLFQFDWNLTWTSTTSGGNSLNALVSANLSSGFSNIAKTNNYRSAAVRYHFK